MCIPSGQITASAVITATRGKLTGVAISPNAAGAGTVDLFDHATAALGTRLIPQITLVAADNDKVKTIMFPSPVIFENGIYCDITTGAGVLNVEAYYENC